ncbi:MAG: hypothetical protein Q8M76_13255, partial [Spirochaetaceae bacterium]|nr:hypothetical protein [Spirochaetaceae bacterium]
VGLPLGWRTGTARKLGLQLVEALVAQLRGELSIETEPVTAFTVVFSADEAAPAPSEDNA